MKKIKNVVIVLGFVVFTLFSFKSITQDEWKVPEEYQNMKNPTDASDKENLSIGKSLYSKHCKSCHGKEGYGDGPKAAEQEGDLGDFSSEDTQSQSDGALFYKITTGREDMPKFEKKIPDAEDRWLIVNYMRTLAE
jgi:mono/diheme cytochrome c family protein